MPALLTKLGVTLAGVLALVLWMAGGNSAAAADAGCQVTAEATYDSTVVAASGTTVASVPAEHAALHRNYL